MFITTLLNDPILFIRLVILIIFSITIHELAHGWAATSQGDDTPKRLGHLTWNPVVHMGVVSLFFLILTGIAWGQMPVNPRNFRDRTWGSILVSAAGPLSNLWLSLMFILLLITSHNFGLSSFVSIDFLRMGAIINFSLFLFNLLPLPPLDGFHVLSELFSEFKSLNNSNIGFFGFMLLSTTGFFSGLSYVSKTVVDTIIFTL